MVTALRSGCDVLSNWSTAGSDIAGTVYAGTNQNGSVGPPGGTHMSFVGKYVDNLSVADLNEITGAGVSVFFYFENPAIQNNAPAATFAQGQADANTVLSSLSSLGLPGTQPVYYAIDFDCSTPDVDNYIINYFSGIISVINTAYVGLYGSVGVYDDLQLAGYLATYFVQSRSTGFRGNGNYVNGMNLWQWPPAYSPSGNVVINGHGVDGVFAYTSDFGQYPRTPGTGFLTYATVTNPSITYTQPQPQALIVPKYDYDHVIFSTVFSTSITASTWPQNVAGPETNIDQFAYPFGNYTATVNGGATQTNDFGFINAANYGSFVGSLPSVVVQPVIDTFGNLSFEVTFNGASGSTTIGLTINIALMATYNPVPTNTSVSQTTAYSNVNSVIQPTPYATYRRIAIDAAIGRGLGKIAHQLGEVPNILYWVGDNSGTLEMQPVAWLSSGPSAQFGISLDDTYIYFYVDSANNERAYYRVYMDN